jgi:acetyl-CoA carboxylase biotin carboxyl carrier protein
MATVRGLADLLDEHSLTEVVVETAEVSITLRRGGVAAMAQVQASGPAMVMSTPHSSFAHAPVKEAAPAAEDKSHVVTSPFVGTFYRKPNPDTPAYVQLNDRVEKGKVLCIVEAMKLMNEIEADVSGTIVGVLVEDGAPVEYGQPLFKIAPL